MIHESEKNQTPGSNSLPGVPFLNLGEKGKLYEPVIVILVRFKSDENNILRQAIHLFSNRPIYYLLFD